MIAFGDTDNHRVVSIEDAKLLPDLGESDLVVLSNREDTSTTRCVGIAYEDGQLF